MIGMFLFLSLGYYVSTSRKPFHAAGTYAVIMALINLAFGGSIGGVIILLVLLFVYASIVYYILESFGDSIFMHLLILLAGTAGIFFLPLLLG